MNLFQKYWSYLFRIKVEQVSSQYNPKLIVAIQDGKYVLNAHNANYSFGSLHRVFQQVFRKLNFPNRDTKSVFLLGGGAGSIPSIIYNELNLNPRIDVVEIDKDVVQLGQKYFGLNEYANLSVYTEDAMNYIQNTTSNYDLIIIDLFKGINVPKSFYQEVFFDAVKKRLNEKGVLIFNFVAYNYETKEQVKIIKRTLEKIFNTEVEQFNLEKVNVVYALRT